jgi:hypothetical protein
MHEEYSPETCGWMIEDDWELNKERYSAIGVDTIEKFFDVKNMSYNQMVDLWPYMQYGTEVYEPEIQAIYKKYWPIWMTQKIYSDYMQLSKVLYRENLDRVLGSISK